LFRSYKKAFDNADEVIHGTYWATGHQFPQMHLLDGVEFVT
jgi:hypothetical protein